MRIELNDAYAIIACEGSEFEPSEKGFDVEVIPDEVLNNPLEWYYYKGEFYHEIPKEVEEYLYRKGIEEEESNRRNAPVLLQTQYITREEFNLLSYQDTNTLYYIIEEDGTATMQKGVN